MTQLRRVAVLVMLEREEKGRETVPLGSVTPSKPSHRLLQKTEGRE